MNWLRSKAKRLSLLALLALAVQFGLSFGHTHLNHAFGKPGITQTAADSGRSAPDTGDTDEACAICATIALANTLIDAAPPALTVPAAVATTEQSTAPAGLTSEMPRAGFHSRAPPLA